MNRWEARSEGLERTFTFVDLSSAFAFMTRVAHAAEAMDHHPEWWNAYRRVHIRLTTHDAGGRVTAKDHQLAEAIDRIAAELGVE